MILLIKSWKICCYRLKVLRYDYRIYMALICVFIFMTYAIFPIKDFCKFVNVKASPFAYPFLMQDVYLSMVLFIGVFPFFVDAPFYSKESLYVYMRVDKFAWMLGNCLYFVICSCFYHIFLFFLSCILMYPQVSLSGEWGKIWTTLALTDARVKFSIPIAISDTILFSYTPIKAVLLTIVFSVLISFLYGVIIWAINVCVGKIISIIFVVFTVVLNTKVIYFPKFFLYLCPIRWADLSSFSFRFIGTFNLYYSLVFLFLGTLFFGLVASIKTFYSDIGK